MKRNALLKCAAVLLAVLFAVQSVPAALAAEEKSKTYSGTVLAAVNTDYSESRLFKMFEIETTGETQQTGAQSDAEAEHAKPHAWEVLWDQIEAMTNEEAMQAQALEGGLVEAQGKSKTYRVGDTRSIPKYPELPDNYDTLTIKEAIKWIFNYMRSSKTQLTCVYTDDVCTVWIEDKNAWDEAAVQKLGEYVGNTIPKLEDLFGDARIDTDGDGKFAIFIHSMQDSEAVVEKQGGYVAGYFTSYDLVNARGKIGNVRMKSLASDSLTFGARADCIHLNINCVDIDEFKDIFVHEYQHYIHACYNYDGKDNKTYLDDDESYINEGFSSASEAILYPTSWRQSEMIAHFNELQEGFSLVTWEGHIANYGLVYPFFQYIRTRYAALTGDQSSDFPGKGIYKLVLQSRDRSNQDNTLGIIADILYPVDRYPSLTDTDARCRQIITDFWLAVFYKDSQGEHGFNGEKWADDLCVRADTLSQEKQQIRNGMAVFYTLNDGKNGTVTILNAEEGFRFIEIGEPMRSLILDPNGGNGDVRTLTGFQTAFQIPSQNDDPVFRDGFVLSGWALTADAEIPEYVPGERVTVKDNLVLYAVWTTAEKIGIGATYTCNVFGERSINVQFSPSEDGVYYLDSSLPYSATVFDSYGSVKEDLLSENDGVYLKAGETYTLYAVFYLLLFDDSDMEECRYALRQRSEYYTLLYYVIWEPDSTDNVWEYRQQYGSTYTVKDGDFAADGKNFIGWSTEPNDADVMYMPGDTITLTSDTTLYAVWKPWFALQPGEPYSIPTQTDSLRFVPQETAVYRFVFTNTDDNYDFTVFSEEQAIDDSYTIRTVTRTYTMYEGQTYYLFTENVGTVTTELVSKELKHTVLLCALNLLDFHEIKSLSVGLTGSNTYVLSGYKPVSLGLSGFAYWLDVVSGDKYYPGDTVVLDRDVVLVAYSESVSVDVTESSSLLPLMLNIGRMVVRYIPAWFSSFAQRIRYYGLSHYKYSVPWFAFG